MQVTCLTGPKILCNGYVINRLLIIVKSLIFNNSLCNGYVTIGSKHELKNKFMH